MPSVIDPKEAFIYRSKYVRQLDILIFRVEDIRKRHASENMDILEEIDEIIEQLKKDLDSFPATTEFFNPLTEFKEYK